MHASSSDLTYLTPDYMLLVAILKTWYMGTHLTVLSNLGFQMNTNMTAIRRLS